MSNNPKASPISPTITARIVEKRPKIPATAHKIALCFAWMRVALSLVRKYATIAPTREKK